MITRAASIESRPPEINATALRFFGILAPLFLPGSEPDQIRPRSVVSTIQLRNVAIIAHVDHGKTTLVDRLLQQTGSLSAAAANVDRVMDSNELERERGITILSKNTAIEYLGYRINVVDTPGHADFGGEVERILSMVDSVLLLVDVFDNLDGSDEQLDFAVVYTSALNGQAGYEPDELADDMQPLLDMILDRVPAPDVDEAGPLQMQISALDYSAYLGVLGVGRINRGVLTRNTPVVVVDRDGKQRKARVQTILGYRGLERVERDSAAAGDIVCVTGIEGMGISETICAPEQPEALPPLSVDEPTLIMMFCVNTSPFAGREGDYLTSRQLKERLFREASHNVALQVRETDDPDRFEVSGRGELHLSVLIETMRREGYELAVSRPQVITREEEGRITEPYELLTADVEERHQGKVMESLGGRRGELNDMQPDGRGRVRLRFRIPTRGLMGYRPIFLSITSGTGILTYASSGYGPQTDEEVGQRTSGVLVSNAEGKAVAYALFNLQNRGRMMVGPNDEVYEGMVVGIHSRDNDLPVNPLKEKKLTNVRAAGSDENILLTSPVRMGLEQALEFINDDELVEVTPRSIRVRKRYLKEHERNRARRERVAARSEGVLG
jgi:GTP-binding protein